MLILFILIAIALGFTINFIFKDWMIIDKKEKLTNIFLFLPCCILASISAIYFSLILLSTPTLCMETEDIDLGTVPIYSLNTIENNSNDFMIGSGVGEKHKVFYWFNKDSGKNYLRLEKEYSANILFITDSSVEPNIKTIGKQLKIDFWSYIFLDLNKASDNQVIITIPENTVFLPYSE